MQPYPDELFFGTLFLFIVPIIGTVVLATIIILFGRFGIKAFLPAHSSWRLKTFLISGFIALVFWILSEKLDTDGPSYVMMLFPRLIVIPISVMVNVISFVLIIAKFFAQKIESRKK